MRRPVEKERLRKFMQDFGAEADQPTRVYLTGGATAVLLGWRASTIDVDLEMVPEDDKLLRSIPQLKESLELNIELASPAHFIPEVPGWEGRSQFIQRDGLVSFFHYDFYAQALAKIERGHSQDVADVKQMLKQRLVKPARLRELFEEIFPNLYRWPAIDPKAFRSALEAILSEFEG
jgi:hypothetical protein